MSDAVDDLGEESIPLTKHSDGVASRAAAKDEKEMNEKAEDNSEKRSHRRCVCRYRCLRTRRLAL